MWSKSNDSSNRGLRVLGVEELSSREMELQTKKPSEKAAALRHADRKAG